MDILGMVVAGFSAVSAALFFGYVLLIELPNKSRHAIISCAMLLAAATLQIFHLVYFRDGTENTLLRLATDGLDHIEQATVAFSDTVASRHFTAARPCT